MVDGQAQPGESKLVTVQTGDFSSEPAVMIQRQDDTFRVRVFEGQPVVVDTVDVSDANKVSLTAHRDGGETTVEAAVDDDTTTASFRLEQAETLVDKTSELLKRGPFAAGDDSSVSAIVGWTEDEVNAQDGRETIQDGVIYVIQFEVPWSSGEFEIGQFVLQGRE